MSEKTEIVPAFDLLSDRERAAYDAWLVKKQPPVAPSTAAKYLEAYLQGSTCEDILKLSKGMALGAIVDCKIRDRWDDRLVEYRATLLDQVGQRLRQVQLESVQHIADQLAVAHKRDGDRLKRFLMTGDNADLGGASFITGIKSYSEAVKALLALTGQDKDKKGPVAVQVSVGPQPIGAAGQTVDAVLVEEPDREQAAKLIELLMPPRGK